MRQPLPLRSFIEVKSAAAPTHFFAAFLVLSLSVPAAGAAGECAVTPSPFWKNTIAVPNDPFQVFSFSQNPGWVKFTILLCDRERVYFQDSNAYAFHYDFARARLDPLLGLSRAAFDQATIYAAGQQAVLGAVILPPSIGSGHPDEYGIQFVRRDPYPPEEVAALFEAVRRSLQASPSARGFYFPAYEQARSAEDHRATFAARGIEVGSPARWVEGNVCYASGWALGTLKRFSAAGIGAAYRDGRLRPGDVLLTDGVPAELPFVAGIISLAPATPNAHVAILARSYGVPFVHLALAADRERALALVGRRMVLRAYPGFEGPDVRLLDVEEALDQSTIAEILALKALPPLAIAPAAPYGAFSAATAELSIAGIRYAGGKAAHYHLLEEAIPVNARPALAFTFDLWNAFLDQPLAGGGTLRGAIRSRLAPYTSYPPASVGALSADLEAVRDLIKDEAAIRFSPELEAAVASALQDPRFAWEPATRLRFRSSTNVEDSEQFTGAGLYDSFSGCLADDLDGDGSGPSRCDPNEAGSGGSSAPSAASLRASTTRMPSSSGCAESLTRMRWGWRSSSTRLSPTRSSSPTG